MWQTAQLLFHEETETDMFSVYDSKKVFFASSCDCINEKWIYFENSKR